MSALNPQEIKNRSEEIILSVGGEILDWLPTIELPKPRALHEVIDRALVLNAMLQLQFKAPKFYITEWLEQNELHPCLTASDLTILRSPNKLTDEEHYELYWSIESLWAIAWATNLIGTLPFDQKVGNLAILSPNLQLHEDGSKYIDRMELRSTESIFAMLDLYYRLHWWINYAIRENKPTKGIDIHIIIARRKALEWLLNSDTVWDELALSL